MRAEMDNFDPTIGDIENTMRKREKQIDSRVGFLNVNVGSIQIEFKSQQKRPKLDFDNQINRTRIQLEYEQKREEQLQQNVRKFERSVQVLGDIEL